MINDPETIKQNILANYAKNVIWQSDATNRDTWEYYENDKESCRNQMDRLKEQLLKTELQHRIGDLDIELLKTDLTPTGHSYLKGERQAYQNIYNYITDCDCGICYQCNGQSYKENQ